MPGTQFPYGLVSIMKVWSCVIREFSGKPIILKNYLEETPILKGGLLLQAAAGYQYSIGWIIIDGFEIQNGHDGIKFYNAHNVIIQNNKIHDHRNQGILGTGYQITIDRNVIAQNGLYYKNTNEAGQHHGIYGTGTYFTITNNLIHSNLSYGIQVAAYPYDSTKHAGVEYSGAKDWLISNNTIAYNLNRSGIVIWQKEAKKILIQNNIFYNNASQADTVKRNYFLS